MTDGPAATTLRLLLVGAPEPERAEVVGNLERAGWRVEWSAAGDRAETLRLLRAPLDLVLLWHVRGAPEPAALIEQVERSARRVPVALVTSPDREREVPETLAFRDQGVFAVVSMDRPAALIALAHQALARGRLDEVIGLVRATCHDLNNLLAVVPLASRSLRHGVEDAFDQRALEAIETAAAQATTAVDSLYRAALWSQGEEGAVRGGVALRHLLESVAGRLRRTFPALQVETDYPPDLGRVGGSPRELRQVLLCLALDAVEVDGRQTALLLAARHHPNGRRVSVVVSATVSAASAGDPAGEKLLMAAIERLGAELVRERSASGVRYLLTLPLVGAGAHGPA